jgi:hypothetical protein
VPLSNVQLEFNVIYSTMDTKYCNGNGWNHKVYHSWVVTIFCEVNHILL